MRQSVWLAASICQDQNGTPGGLDNISSTGTELRVAPLDDEANVNMRRAELGLMRIELYARLVRHRSPDQC
jgi:hypothetical protein